MLTRRVSLYVVAVCLAFFGLSESANGGLLDLELQPYPDVTSGFLDVMYSAGTDQLTASGFAITISNEGVGGLVDIIGGRK